MSSYSGRRAPNVSQYLANLNTIPGPQEEQNDFGQLGDDLDFLTNAEFFDFDSFNNADPFPPQGSANGNTNGMAEQKPSVTTGGGSSFTAATVQYNGDSGERTLDPRFQFSEFQTCPKPSHISPTSTTTSTPYAIQPPVFPAGSTGEKRKASAAALPSPADVEEASRFAAEEDKRRRNTAASARFRVKKKQREQALEKQAKEMSEKVQMLEGKVQQLEMENKWLKGLIVEKGKEGEKVEGAEADERSTEARTDGVGTMEEVKA